jgi:hypothetical protein
MLYSSDSAPASRNALLISLQIEAHGKEQGEAGYVMDFLLLFSIH